MLAAFTTHFGETAETRAQVLCRWLHSGGRTQAPQWEVRSPSSVTIDRSTMLRGELKVAYAAKLKKSGADVLVKTWHSWSNSRANRTVHVFHECALLERLRGLAGIPTLHGGWFSEDSSFHYVVQHAGRAVGSANTHRETHTSIGTAASPTRLNPEYVRLASARPYTLARAILRCFQSFAEVGGYFLDDFNAKQFALDASAREPAIYVIDAPDALSDAARHACVGPHGSGKASRQWFAPKCLFGNHSGEPRWARPRGAKCMAPDAACERDFQCPSTNYKHSCSVPGKPCEPGSAGAPESQPSCVRRAGGSTCRPLNISARTHVFDVAAKKWLLPLVARVGAPEMWPLVSQMRSPRPDDRPDFAQALAALAALEKEHLGRRRHRRLPPYITKL